MISSAFAQRGHIVHLRFLTESLYIAVTTDEAGTPEEAVAVALTRKDEALFNTMLGAETHWSETLGPLLTSKAFPDTEVSRMMLGISGDEEVETTIDPDMYDGPAFGTKLAIVCKLCDERLMKHEAGRGDECDSCRMEAKIERTRPHLIAA
jgi:hypothetical protein